MQVEHLEPPQRDKSLVAQPWEPVAQSRLQGLMRYRREGGEVQKDEAHRGDALERSDEAGAVGMMRRRSGARPESSPERDVAEELGEVGLAGNTPGDAHRRRRVDRRVGEGRGAAAAAYSGADNERPRQRSMTCSSPSGRLGSNSCALRLWVMPQCLWTWSCRSELPLAMPVNRGGYGASGGVPGGEKNRGKREVVAALGGGRRLG